MYTIKYSLNGNESTEKERGIKKRYETYRKQKLQGHT